ncbi:MAG: YkgJ family cysteine cluster protein [Desulfuromonadaceae bacterium]
MSDLFDFGKYAEHVQSLTMEELQAAEDGAGLATMMGRINTVAETALKLHGDSDEHIACQAGCGACCVVNVAVLFPELVAIADFVQTQFEREQQLSLDRRLACMTARVAGLNEEERILLREPCAFLDAAQNCSIYPVRPLICRSVTSIDVRHCEEALRLVAFAEERPIFQNIFQKNLLDETFIALAQGLTQLGFDDRSEQLTLGMQQLLASPQQVERFLDRQPVWGD